MEDFLANNAGIIIPLLFGVILGILIGAIGTVFYVRSNKKTQS